MHRAARLHFPNYCPLFIVNLNDFPGWLFGKVRSQSWWKHFEMQQEWIILIRFEPNGTTFKFLKNDLKF